MSRAWKKLFDAETPEHELADIIETQIAAALADLREELDADGGLTPTLRRAAVVAATPLIRERTTQTLRDAWLRLRRQTTVGSLRVQ